MSELQTGTRVCVRVAGSERFDFLQGILTNDVMKVRNGLVYAAMLTPQGKYLVDMFLHEDGDAIILDVDEACLETMLTRMQMYRLRSDVSIEATGCHVSTGIGGEPPGAFADPRHPELGWRKYDCARAGNDLTDLTALRVLHCIPETLIELVPGSTYILEAGFERLNGVDFGKGCYVGQEVTARMKHKTRLRKQLVTVEIDSSVPSGTGIRSAGRSVGTVFSQSNNRAIAFLRLDRVGDGELMADDARVSLL